LNVADLILTPPADIAKKCKVSPLDVKDMVEVVCAESSRQVRVLDDAKDEGAETFTTADTRLDDALGGGMRTRMIWEVVGERYLVLFRITDKY
jgi:DNA repair protein RAD57